MQIEKERMLSDFGEARSLIRDRKAGFYFFSRKTAIALGEEIFLPAFLNLAFDAFGLEVLTKGCVEFLCRTFLAASKEVDKASAIFGIGMNAGVAF